jgi:hypothetical protein
MSDVEELQAKLLQLTLEHRDLDNAIDALIDSAAYDQLQVLRLKKRKLRLKDMMVRIEGLIHPDIIA